MNEREIQIFDNQTMIINDNHIFNRLHIVLFVVGDKRPHHEIVRNSSLKRLKNKNNIFINKVYITEQISIDVDIKIYGVINDQIYLTIDGEKHVSSNIITPKYEIEGNKKVYLELKLVK